MKTKRKYRRDRTHAGRNRLLQVHVSLKLQYRRRQNIETNNYAYWLWTCRYGQWEWPEDRRNDNIDSEPTGRYVIIVVGAFSVRWTHVNREIQILQLGTENYCFGCYVKTEEPVSTPFVYLDWRSPSHKFKSNCIFDVLWKYETVWA